MNNMQQNKDGSWTEAEPLPASKIVKLEFWLRRHKMAWLANALVAWDERKLGK